MRKLLLVANVSKEHIRKFHIPFILKMREKGWTVDVACRLDEPIPECDHTFDLPCDRNPFHGGLKTSVKMLRQIIRDNKYDVVHCNTVTGSMVARIAAKSFRKQGIKVFYTNHGLHFFKGASLRRWICGFPMEKLLARVTDVLITINKADFEMAKKYLGACKNIEKIHGIGVDLSRFRNCKFSFENRAEYRKRFEIPEEAFVLTYVAELNENKNQKALIKVFDIVRKAIPSSKLLLVGPDHTSGKLQELVSECGLDEKVIFTGWREDIPELLNISDIYVASSKSEGLGLNLIEAMACNIPVVAFKNRGHCEIINHGKNGFLVEQEDYEKMAEYVIQLYENKELRRRVTDQAQKDISKYEVQNVLNELCFIYEKYC